MATNVLQRDAFIEEIYKEAVKNKDIYFLCADLGAKALDKFREEIPEQFIHVGISEQNMIDVAAGLAIEGKIVYAYAMAPFVTIRCLEQIKVALASMNLPVTIIAVGVGYSYAPAGPTHYATEDISVMRSMGNMEIYTPSDTLSTRRVAQLTYETPRLRYIRLDRACLKDVYDSYDDISPSGLKKIAQGDDICVLATGYMVEQAMECREILQREGVNIAVVDVQRVKPLDTESLFSSIRGHRKLVTLEEHFLSGGFGSAICEVVCDYDLPVSVTRIGIKENYYKENYKREELNSFAGVGQKDILGQLRKLAHNKRESGFRESFHEI